MTRAESTAPRPPGSALYASFIRAALVCTLTLGATFGAVNLLFIHLSLGRVPAAHNWIHASFQIWGFVLLFTMGIAYHAVPRLLDGHLAETRLARATLQLLVAGLLATTYGRFGRLLPWTAPVYFAGALLTVAAVAAWGFIMYGVWRRAAALPKPFHAFLFAGTLWWLAAAVLAAFGGALGFAQGDPDVPACWNDAVYAAALYGGTLAWIQGMLLRTGPRLLQLAPSREGAVAVAFGLGQVGAALAVLGGLLLGHSGALAAEDAGLLCLAGATASFAFGLRPFSCNPAAGARHLPVDPHFARIVQLSLAFSLLFAAMSASYGATDLAGLEPGKLLHDGARHAFVLGFVTLMIFGMAGRIVPIFAGVELHRPRLRYMGSYFIAGGVLMREVQVAAAFFRCPPLLYVSGVSGLVAAGGVAMASVSILGTLKAANRKP